MERQEEEIWESGKRYKAWEEESRKGEVERRTPQRPLHCQACDKAESGYSTR